MYNSIDAKVNLVTKTYPIPNNSNERLSMSNSNPNSMSFSTTDLSTIFESAINTKATAKSAGTKNAQYYKERLEAHVTDLSVSDVDAVRLAVVSSLNASASILKAMLEVECDENIIGVILTHPNLSKSVKTSYVKKNKDLVQSIIEKSDVTTEDDPSETTEDQTINEESVNEALNA